MHVISASARRNTDKVGNASVGLKILELSVAYATSIRRQ